MGARSRRISGSLVAVLSCASLFAPPARAQRAISGYALNVGTWSGDSPLAEGSAADFQRLRLMAEPAWGPVRIELAWDHLAVLQQPAAVGVGLLAWGWSRRRVESDAGVPSELDAELDRRVDAELRRFEP